MQVEKREIGEHEAGFTFTLLNIMEEGTYSCSLNFAQPMSIDLLVEIMGLPSFQLLEVFYKYQLSNLQTLQCLKNSTEV